MFYSRQKEECYEIVYRKCSSICAGINNAYTDDIKCAKQKENLGKPTRLKPVFLTDPGRTVYDLHKQEMCLQEDDRSGIYTFMLKSACV